VIAALDKLRTAYRLGPANVMRKLAYQTGVRSGIYRRRLPIGSPISGPFIVFGGATTKPADAAVAGYWRAEAEAVMAGSLRLFSDQRRQCGFPPDWGANALTGRSAISPGRHWTEIEPLGRPGDDIKGYWEPSRFDGLIALTLGWLVSREQRFADAWNVWIADWSEHNPINAGVNWLCGQETGLRLLQTLLCAELIAMQSDSRLLPTLDTLVFQHCQRIAATLLYAVAQDNNHGTSEAAALYVGGAWLQRRGDLAARHWLELGRGWLERLAARLIMPDGSFAQNSVNYHRLALDTLSLAEFWRRRFNETPFSELFNSRCRAAAEWLLALTDPASGNAPNLGANDGARIAVLHRLPYRDFRPSIALAEALFSDSASLSQGPWNESLAWLDIEPVPIKPAEWRARLFSDGGFAKLVAGESWCLLRLPHYRFRPSQSDALHLDLWSRGTNVLRDGGSYSYNCDRDAMAYFSGTRSHNTVQFDDRDQMPRLGPFLLGAWLTCDELDYDGERQIVSAAYRDAWGARHCRRVELATGRCVVYDEIAGFSGKAVLRWRLAPAGWHLDGKTLTSPLGRLSVSSPTAPIRMTLEEGWESLHYASRTPVPVLETTFDRPAAVTTTIEFDGGA
jgi:hypothetical protein